MYRDLSDFSNSENKKCFQQSLNNYRENSFLAIQENKYINKVNSIDISKVYPIFFSAQNIGLLQQMIKDELFKQTRGKFILVVDQDEKSLREVMNNVIKNENIILDNLVVQNKKLNQKVLEFVMPNIITSIKQYDGYIKKINSPLQPMNRPINVNGKGRKQLRSITTVWN